MNANANVFFYKGEPIMRIREGEKKSVFVNLLGEEFSLNNKSMKSIPRCQHEDNYGIQWCYLNGNKGDDNCKSRFCKKYKIYKTSDTFFHQLFNLFKSLFTKIT